MLISISEGDCLDGLFAAILFSAGDDILAAGWWSLWVMVVVERKRFWCAKLGERSALGSKRCVGISRRRLQMSASMIGPADAANQIKPGANSA